MIIGMPRSLLFQRISGGIGTASGNQGFFEQSCGYLCSRGPNWWAWREALPSGACMGSYEKCFTASSSCFICTVLGSRDVSSPATDNLFPPFSRVLANVSSLAWTASVPGIAWHTAYCATSTVQVRLWDLEGPLDQSLRTTTPNLLLSTRAHTMGVNSIDIASDGSRSVVGQCSTEGTQC